MPSIKLYFCRGCPMPGRTRKWIGPCPNCRSVWSIIERRTAGDDYPDGYHVEAQDGEVVALCDVSEDEDVRRIEIGGKFYHIDELLGGEQTPGFMPTSINLLAGPPGIGKSTLILQLCQRLARRMTVLYITNEESTRQVAFRSRRLGKFNERLLVLREGDLDQILDKIDDIKPKIVILDSAQTLVVTSPRSGEELEPGSTMSIKTAMQVITDYAKRENVTFVVVGHVTHDGTIAGGRSGLEHAVDVVMYFDGDEKRKERTLRCPNKNRFGPAGVLAPTVKLEMGDRGLTIVEKDDDAEKDDDESSDKEEKTEIEQELESDEEDDSDVNDDDDDDDDDDDEHEDEEDDKTSEKTLPAPPPLWTAPDGTTAAAVLRIVCQVDGCRGKMGRACTASNGTREAGFHQSRVERANPKLLNAVVATGTEPS